MAIAVTILFLLVAGAILGSAINFGSIFLGIPIVLMFVGALIGRETLDRQRRILRLKRFRREARAQKVDFETDDRRTLAA